MTKFGVSQPVRRREDNRLLTGAGGFVDDLSPGSLAFGYALRSPVASGRILSLEAAAARRLPGVLLVLTAADLAGSAVSPIACLVKPAAREGTTFSEYPQPILVRDDVHYAGDTVAFVVAESADAARDAAELIEVDYEPGPAATGCARAAGSEAPRLRSDAADNISFQWESGDRSAVDAAFAAAERVVRLEVLNNRVVLSAVETRGCLAEYDPAGAEGAGKYTLTVASQMPNPMKAQVAQCLGVEPGRVRVCIPADVGGGFGGKNSLYPEYPLCLIAAERLGRPVKWVGERGDAFLTDFHGRDNAMQAAMAFDAEGMIQAIRIHSYADMGAYTASRGTVSPVNGFVMLSNTYRIPAMYAEVTAAHTNTAPTDPYRGAGRPEVTHTIERLMDYAALQLGIDRVELRRRNLIPPEAFPYRTPTGLNYDPCDFAMVMDEAMARAGWSGIEERRREAVARGRRRGIGMSNYIERCGGGGGLSEGARLEFDEDGGVTVYSGSQANGQGHETAFSQIVNEYLGLPFDKIRVVEGDTDRIATGTGTGGSWSIPMGGGAIAMAAEKVIEKARRIAGHLLEAAPADIEFADGDFRVAGTDLAVSFERVLQASLDPAQLPEGEEPGLDEAATFTPENYTYPYGCHIAEVELDPETGAVELVGYTCVHDFGRALNPMLLAGQVHGGVAQGIGQALFEHTVYGEDGQLLSGSFMDYCVPRSDQLPSFDFEPKETPSPQNLMGVKGCGEAGAAGSPPAVINALVDAMREFGVEHFDMPATPERVWRAIQG